tara:strand:- start:141 stop:1022 length:882 start_codon:yes stop_codon:yes gene_type:complete
MRIIFSTYIEFEDSEFDNDEDLKKNLKNKNLFKKNYKFLIKQHKKYADHLKIKYKLFVDDDNWKNYKKYFKINYPYISNYNIINFYKIHLLYELIKKYDEVLYLDFDVVPLTKENIFEYYDLDEGIVCKVNHEKNPVEYFNRLTEKSDYYNSTGKTFSQRSPEAKYWNCKAMLLNKSLNDDNDVYNTGIVLANKKNLKKLNYFDKFSQTLNFMTKLKNEEGMWPDFIRSAFGYDNETLFSFKMKSNKVNLIKMDDVWHHTIYKWSFIPHGTKMVHVINKDFQCVKRHVKKNNI